MRDMEIGIMQCGDGVRLFSTHRAVRDAHGEWGIEVSNRRLYETMLSLAVWANNDIGVGCLFYMG